MLRLNLGCGSTKFEGYVNIDVEDSCKPDLVHDFTSKPLPYEDGAVDEIVMFHTIEHIQKGKHPVILGELRRVLKVGGRLILTYPNFWVCANNWKNNFQGQRDYWHATMFGRQLYQSDYHVCAMDPIELEITLRDCGFGQCQSKPEPVDTFNHVTVAFAVPFTTYKELLEKDFQATQVV